MNRLFFYAMAAAIAGAMSTQSFAESFKPRMLVLTDISTWETDDHESLIRLLAHADMFEIEGIVISTGYSISTLNKEPERGFINIAKGVVDAYEKDLPNLMKRSGQTGHAHDGEALTGCTVVICEQGAVGGAGLFAERRHTVEQRVCARQVEIALEVEAAGLGPRQGQCIQGIARAPRRGTHHLRRERALPRQPLTQAPTIPMRSKKAVKIAGLTMGLYFFQLKI